MSTEHKLPHKLVSALVYLQWLRSDTDEELLISVTKDKVVVTTAEDVLNAKVLTPTEYHINPIKDILEHVNEEMCTDCLSYDSYFKNDYFKSLVRAYVDSLVHEYGLTVPITPELAIAIVQHDISEYEVTYFTNSVIPYSSYRPTLTKDSLPSLGKITNYTFHLKAR